MTGTQVTHFAWYVLETDDHNEAYGDTKSFFKIIHEVIKGSNLGPTD